MSESSTSLRLSTASAQPRIPQVEIAILERIMDLWSRIQILLDLRASFTSPNSPQP